MDAFSIIVYPLLFLGLYFEVFLILTLFEREARRRRSLTTPTSFPTVSIIVPCYNEEATAAATIESVLALEYPEDKLTAILVDDGSTDGTRAVLERYQAHPQIKIIAKENGGKHTALNAGIAIAGTEFVGCLDADSFVTPKALKLAMANFDDEKIGAVTASMSVNKPTNMLERMQEAEYLIGIAMRHTLAIWNGLYVTPGPFTIYRARVFAELGQFRPAHDTEDMEIAMRLQRAGWKIQNAPAAAVYTNAPKTVKALVKQRVRWTSGFMRNALDYRDLVGNPRHGALGILVLPLAILSIFSGVFLFALSVFRFSSSVWQFGVNASEVPLSFTLTPHVPDWFYFPLSTLAFLSLAAVVLTLALIYTGAWVTRKQTRLGFALLWYFIVYSFIAVWWRIRAITDVALGIRRSWR
ncbi:MAG: glycosyltransferase [Patescibacteria group bacterium]|nr:glycosyltransferase [Patescibacteria group bacterium]